MWGGSERWVFVRVKIDNRRRLAGWPLWSSGATPLARAASEDQLRPFAAVAAILSAPPSRRDVRRRPAARLRGAIIAPLLGRPARHHRRRVAPPEHARGRVPREVQGRQAARALHVLDDERRGPRRLRQPAGALDPAADGAARGGAPAAGEAAAAVDHRLRARERGGGGGVRAAAPPRREPEPHRGDGPERAAVPRGAAHAVDERQPADADRGARAAHEADDAVARAQPDRLHLRRARQQFGAHRPQPLGQPRRQLQGHPAPLAPPPPQESILRRPALRRVPGVRTLQLPDVRPLPRPPPLDARLAPPHRRGEAARRGHLHEEEDVRDDAPRAILSARNSRRAIPAQFSDALPPISAGTTTCGSRRSSGTRRT